MSVLPFEICVGSSDLEVRDALRQFMAAIAMLELRHDQYEAIELAMAEALNNVAEHAYPETRPQDRIRIICRQFNERLHARIVDQGHPMPFGAVPAGNAANVKVELDQVPEGGFGWFLIRDLVDSVSYCRIGQDNHLDLQFSINARSPVAEVEHAQH